METSSQVHLSHPYPLGVRRFATSIWSVIGWGHGRLIEAVRRRIEFVFLLLLVGGSLKRECCCKIKVAV
jgi:hypothetical protein